MMPRSLREQLTGRCRHVTPHGLLKDRAITCEAGVSYYDLARIDELGYDGCALRLPCGGIVPGTQTRGHVVQACEQYSPLTEEEIQAEIDEQERFVEAIAAHKSPCCGAPINEDRVIRTGRHRGHGPRFCSNCGKLIFMV